MIHSLHGGVVDGALPYSVFAPTFQGEKDKNVLFDLSLNGVARANRRSRPIGPNRLDAGSIP
jgi:hypothetical protein